MFVYHEACDNDGGTLRRVCVWAQEPLHRLTWLANIAHAAHHKKGILEYVNIFKLPNEIFQFIECPNQTL